MDKKKPTIIFTGGGTAGHVTPNIALIEQLRHDWRIYYIGSKKSIEQDMMASLEIPFFTIKTGKLRRYFSWKNVIAPFNILLGVIQAYWLIRKFNPHVIFSKGGFVAFPVVIGGWLNRIPIVAHESDMTPGLANRMSFPFVSKICVAFAPTKSHFKNQDKVFVTGTPIRQSLLRGDKQKALRLCNFDDSLPCLLVIGGSQGSNAINQCIRTSLNELLAHYQVIHLCGKGKIDTSLMDKKGYCQFEYANQELADLFAASSLVVSRAGANALCELLVLVKPHILIPLPKRASRGDQIENARYFSQEGISVVIHEETLNQHSLMAAIVDARTHEQEIVQKIRALDMNSAAEHIANIIREATRFEYSTIA